MLCQQDYQISKLKKYFTENSSSQMKSKQQRQKIDRNDKYSLSQESIQGQMQEKQQYLREQILQKNFNPQDFIEYLNQKLNIDSDISKCSFEDLKKIVKSYISKVKKFQIHMSQFSEQKEAQQSQRSSMFQSVCSLAPVVMVKLNSQPLIVEQQFCQIVKCCQIQQRHNASEMKSKNIQCKVYSPQRKFVTSILGINTSSYLEFKIKTFGLGWQVGRRYSDFIWLRNTLKKFYPSQVIPPIPNKKAHKRSAKQLQKRMKMLTLFLNQLLSFSQFLNSKYVQGFLSLSQSKFSSFKKQIDNKKSFQSFSTTQTLSGDFAISLNKEVVKYNKQMINWIDQSQVLLKDLTRSSKTLRIQIIDQVNTLYDMGDILASLHRGAQKISKLDSRSGNGFYKMKQIFVTLNNMVVEWGSVLKSQIQLIQTNCNWIYKYVRQSLDGYSQLTRVMKQHEANYFDTKINLDMQKQKLFALHDVQKWDIPKKQLSFIPKSAIYQKKEAFKLMLPKQSSALQKLKKTYCYYLSRIYQNVDQSLSRKAGFLCSSMQEFTIKQKVVNQQIGQMWNQMSYNFSHAFGQKKINKDRFLSVRTQDKIRKDDIFDQNNEEWSESTIGNAKMA